MTRAEDQDQGDLIPRPAPNPVVLCLPPGHDRAEVEPLVALLRSSGREVLVATRPLGEHRAGRKVAYMEKLGARLRGRRVHWVGLCGCAGETFNTLSAQDGVASLVLLDPELGDVEPGHPGRGDVPKLLLRRLPEGRRPPRVGPPERFIGNILGPVEVKVIRSDQADELPQVVMEFIERADRGEAT